jgi:hypothetical protein
MEKLAMAGFAKFYASVADDIRHKVVEEGWFGRQVTDAQNPAFYELAPKPTDINAEFSEVGGNDIKPSDLYGEFPAIEAPTIDHQEPTFDAIEPPDGPHHPDHRAPVGYAVLGVRHPPTAPASGYRARYHSTERSCPTTLTKPCAGWMRSRAGLSPQHPRAGGDPLRPNPKPLQ